ncbi:MAG: choice-of-anchor D domain-containing protein, partial [Planctomycetota bacterium]
NNGAGPLEFTLDDEDVITVAKVLRQTIEKPYQVPLGLNPAKGEPDTRHGLSPTEGMGGPDLFGHRWIDSDEPGGPTFNWIDISGVGTPVSLGDDDFIEVTLPFTFSFYGVDHTLIKISSNGYLTFGPDGTDFSNDPIPDPNDPNDFIAPFWDDLNPSQGGMIYYYSPDPNTFIVQWDQVPHFGSGGPYTFEAILKSNGQMLFQYLDMNSPLESATIGIENFDASDGLEVVFNAPYMHNNLAIRIAADSPWLSENPTSGMVPPGGSMDVQIIADATGLLGGTYRANVIINSNDPVHPDTTMPVRLNVGGTPDIDVQPNPLVFPDPVFVGGADSAMIYVRNLGNIDLNVSDITSNNPAFSVNLTQFSVPPFDSVGVQVTFAPTSVGTITGSLTITSDDPDEPTFGVSVQGEAIPAPAIAVNPDTIDVDLINGDSTDVLVQISNVGGSDLTWSASATGNSVAVRPMTIKPGAGTATRSRGDLREMAPRTSEHPYPALVIEAPFDLQFSFDVQAASGALGNAGSEYHNGEYFTTRWASNLIHRYDLTGTLLEEFSITGVTNLRDLASDGT